MCKMCRISLRNMRDLAVAIMGCLPITCQIPVLAHNTFTTPNYSRIIGDTLHFAHMTSYGLFTHPLSNICHRTQLLLHHPTTHILLETPYTLPTCLQSQE